MGVYEDTTGAAQEGLTTLKMPGDAEERKRPVSVLLSDADTEQTDCSDSSDSSDSPDDEIEQQDDKTIEQ
ncbi:hypothetical protein PSACC_02287 [Paramicrosporidium saccamoebae]|uniref:Uncharacterized protein n=1 Tax=Paramicrosporidium saccamoebae TaxID=1246581 RepID=A0A2H9TJQ7_9FUNG|nr:hypothetical protein PSACC_02287 [Paramicrosporidium saccamoebae]